MAGIFFGISGDWMVSGWIFSRLLDRALLLGAEGDDEITRELQASLGYKGLSVHLMDPVPAERLVSLLERVATQELGRTHEDLDMARRKMYREALSDLLELMKKDQRQD